ncbi:MAG TPA: FAD binding domain-containing protein [Streptosporangiaceae bacterium]|nr:FAD binding domain-containing protein [Streptosporangiaceae bacterium]
MDFYRPDTLAGALEVKAEHPGALPIAGGTDVMVEINFDTRRPTALLDLTRIGELTEWSRDGAWLRVGAGVSYTRLIAELGALLPGLALAARTVGSPQIRNRGTIGGNLGAASPAGDCHPVLLASGARIEAASLAGTRIIPAADFYLGPKRNALSPDELIISVLIPVRHGPQQFAKVGTRNAMVIAVCAFALELRPAGRGVGTGIGSAGPTPLRATEAERFLGPLLPWDTPGGPLPPDTVSAFGDLVAGAARPIDDVRGSAAYRRHALAVLARRTLTWAWQEYN